MWFNIIFFLGACLVNAGIRAVVRFDIPKKHWRKQKSGNLIPDWFLWTFREGQRKIWIDLHLAFFIAILVAFALGVIGFFIEQVAALQVLPMVVCFLCLGVFACGLFRGGAPTHAYGYGNKRPWKENSIFAVIFILFMFALSICLGYTFIKDLFNI